MEIKHLSWGAKKVMGLKEAFRFGMILFRGHDEHLAFEFISWYLAATVAQIDFVSVELCPDEPFSQELKDRSAT